MRQFLMTITLVIGLTALVFDLFKSGKPKTAEVLIENENKTNNKFERIKVCQK